METLCYHCGKPGTDIYFNITKAEAILNARRDKRTYAIIRTKSKSEPYAAVANTVDAIAGRTVMEYISQYY